MTLLELTLETAINEAGEFKDVRLSKEDAACILALLKEQEAVKPRLGGTEYHDGHSSFWYRCGKCETRINYGDKFCRCCGQAVKWE